MGRSEKGVKGCFFENTDSNKCSRATTKYKTKKNEGIRQYGCRLEEAREALELAFTNEFGASSENSKLKSNEKAVLSFEEGLSNEVIKRKTSQKNYKLLREAVTFASELEKTVGTNTSNSETTNTPRTGCRVCKIPGHSTDQCHKLGRMLSIDTTSDYCSYCRRHGHKIADCRTKRYAEGMLPKWQPKQWKSASK